MIKNAYDTFDYVYLIRTNTVYSIYELLIYYNI